MLVLGVLNVMTYVYYTDTYVNAWMFCKYSAPVPVPVPLQSVYKILFYFFFSFWECMNETSDHQWWCCHNKLYCTYCKMIMKMGGEEKCEFLFQASGFMLFMAWQLAFLRMGFQLLLSKVLTMSEQYWRFCRNS